MHDIWDSLGCLIFVTEANQQRGSEEEEKGRIRTKDHDHVIYLKLTMSRDMSGRRVKGWYSNSPYATGYSQNGYYM